MNVNVCVWVCTRVHERIKVKFIRLTAVGRNTQ